MAVRLEAFSTTLLKRWANVSLEQLVMLGMKLLPCSKDVVH